MIRLHTNGKVVGVEDNGGCLHAYNMSFDSWKKERWPEVEDDACPRSLVGYLEAARRRADAQSGINDRAKAREG